MTFRPDARAASVTRRLAARAVAGRPRFGARAGFTLIELMLAVTVFSALLLVAIPRYRDFERAMSMKAATRNLATNLRLAQQKASAANRRCYVDFDEAQRFFSIWVDQDLDGAYDGAEEVKAVGFPHTDQVGGMLGMQLPVGISFESTTFPDGIRGLPSVAFTSDGSAADAGDVILRDGWGRRYKVEVSLAGAISIFKDVNGSWIE